MASHIKQKQLYEVEHSYKTNGEWMVETLIVAGCAMRAYGFHLEPYREHIVRPDEIYALHDGHLPDYRPLVFGRDLMQAMVYSTPPIAVIANLEGKAGMSKQEIEQRLEPLKQTLLESFD